MLKITNILPFSKNDIFHNTSSVGSNPEKLNTRFQILFNGVNLKGKKVLDLGCHNGRWMHVCLSMGAAHVTGIDAIENYIDKSNSNLLTYPQSKWECIQIDILEFLKTCQSKFDLIMCLGVMYHTLDQYEILKNIKRLQPKLTIIDSEVMLENTSIETSIPKKFIKPEYTWGLFRKRPIMQDWELIPTAKMLEVWMTQSGLTHKKINNFIHNEYDKNYRSGERVGYHCY